MQRMEPTPAWLAARLADDVANFLQIQQDIRDLADYDDALLTLAEVVRTARNALRRAAGEAMNMAVVR